MINKTKIDYDVILIEPKIEGNIGAIARICNNFDVNKLILITPQTDHLSVEARNRAKHSQYHLNNAIIYNSFEEIRYEYSILIGTSAKAGKSYNVRRQPIYPWNLKEITIPAECKIGFVFGREDRGLSNEEIGLCDFLITIPVSGQLKVLNISHAVAVILYEFWKIITNSEIINDEEISSTYKEKEILFSLFNKITDALTYEEYRKPIAQHTFHNIINRSFASKEEIHSLIGIFKTILHQQNNDNDSG